MRPLILIAFLLAIFLAGGAAEEEGGIGLGPDVVRQILRHGPWPPELAPDPSNRVSGSEAAAALGEVLFFDARLSRAGDLSCGSCHDPERGWTDGLEKARGAARLDRNTQSLFNVRFNRWFGWDGRNDSLWAHSIGPILEPREMAADAGHVAGVIAGDADLAQLYQDSFGRAPADVPPVDLLVDAAKSIAAFQETILSGRTPFDDFRDALAAGDHDAAARYPEAARRGAAIFFGRGKCHFCHTGPLFSNGEFGDAGVPYFTGPGRVDPGRHGGIERLRASPYSLTGRHNDRPGEGREWATRQVALTPKTFGEFKVPSLRNLTLTHPYMHNGSLATLEDVVRHYSTIDLERLHSEGERILAPLGLDDRQVADLVAFLETLSPEEDGNGAERP